MWSNAIWVKVMPVVKVIVITAGIFFLLQINRFV